MDNEKVCNILYGLIEVIEKSSSDGSGVFDYINGKCVIQKEIVINLIKNYIDNIMEDE